MAAAIRSVQDLDPETLDQILTLQILIAWAGEEGDEPRRFGWWRTAMVDEFGGEDLFRRVLPSTWRWAVIEAARAAARKVDARHRAKAADPDSLRSLYSLGFALDEALDDRFAELKRTVSEPVDALPGLERMKEPWSAEAFSTWLADLAPASFTATPAGRRLEGARPQDPYAATRSLAAAHAAPGDTYPAPHYVEKR